MNVVSATNNLKDIIKIAKESTELVWGPIKKNVNERDIENEEFEHEPWKQDEEREALDTIAMSTYEIVLGALLDKFTLDKSV